MDYIKLKHSPTAGEIPAPTELEMGELAFNSTDDTLFFKDTNNKVKGFPLSATSGSVQGDGVTIVPAATPGQIEVGAIDMGTLP